MCVLGQDYIITGPADTQYIPNYRQNPDFNPFRPNFQQIDSYLPQRDLQTSDLPYHLQQTLPQYRPTTKTPPRFTWEYRGSPPAPFRPQETIVPSTHRPNYSHLFSHAHNRNPQTETFLGEITLQNPADVPPRFNPSQAIDVTEKTNTVTIGGRGNFLNHRTRIFAPESSKKQQQVKNYFVNTNGEVFGTTKQPKTTTTSEERKEKKKFDFEPLLEAPIRSVNSGSDDVVEVVKSRSGTTTVKNEEDTTDFDYDTTLDPSVDYEEEKKEEDPIKHLEELRKNHPVEDVSEEEAEDTDDKEKEKPEGSNKKEEETDDEEYPTSEEDNSSINSEENNNIRDEDYEDKSTNSTYEIVTTKPSLSSENHFEEFNDTTVIDSSTTEETPTTLPTRSKTEALLSEPETVVSVVTTKSVINNTVLPTATPLPTATLTSENTTDTWVVVASVQTSRSVSGARYLPSSNVEQDERIKLLNEEEEEEEETEAPTTVKQKTSTESLIDKLDRVQSDLSSSVFNGGFKNIAVITENMTMQDMGVTEPTPPPSSTKPLVNIRKFSSLARPSTTKRPQKTFEPKHQKTTVSSLDVPQGDEPPKIGRSSGISNKTKITLQDVSAFLPPGYKNPDKDNDSSKLLAEILGKVTSPKPKTIDGLLAKAKPVDVSAFLPPGYKPTTSPKPKTDDKLLAQAKPVDVSAFLPPGFKPNKTVDGLLSQARPDDVSAFLPPGFKPTPSSKPKTVDGLLAQAKPVDVSAFLPPGFKPNKTVDGLLLQAKPVDVSSFLPPGYKPTPSPKPKTVDGLLAQAKPVDVSAFLPPGYKPTPSPKPKGVDGLLAQAKPVDISAFLPPGYKARTTPKPLTTPEKVPSSLLPPGYKLRESTTTSSTTTTSTSTTSKPSSGFKVVFPSRPGGNIRKASPRLTTAPSVNTEEPKATPPTIHKGWPSRFVFL